MTALEEELKRQMYASILGASGYPSTSDSAETKKSDYPADQQMVFDTESAQSVGDKKELPDLPEHVKKEYGDYRTWDTVSDEQVKPQADYPADKQVVDVDNLYPTIAQDQGQPDRKYDTAVAESIVPYGEGEGPPASRSEYTTMEDIRPPMETKVDEQVATQGVAPRATSTPRSPYRTMDTGKGAAPEDYPTIAQDQGAREGSGQQAPDALTQVERGELWRLPWHPSKPVERGELWREPWHSSTAGFAVADPDPDNPDYKTPLSPDEEKQFRKWVKDNKVPFDDSPRSDYDMRGFWKAQQEGDPDASTAVSKFDGKPHFSDKFKTPFHKTFSNESQYATSDAPHWDGNKLIDNNGNVVADETPSEVRHAAKVGETPRAEPVATPEVRRAAKVGETPKAAPVQDPLVARAIAKNIADQEVLPNLAKPRVAAAAEEPTANVEPGESRIQPGKSLIGTDNRITNIMAAASRALPPGYHIAPTSGVRTSGQGQHTLGRAQDWQIIGPDGNPISNRGSDKTGLYTLLARNAYGYQEKYYPELTGKFQWGGQFGTSSRNNEEPDLMHFDIGGRRGHIAQYSRETIGAALPPGAGGADIAGRPMSAGEKVDTLTTLNRMALDGLNVTHFGYKSDPNGDPESVAGHGAYVDQMVPGYDVALNEAAAARLGVRPGQVFQYAGRTWRYGDKVPERYKDARFDIYDRDGNMLTGEGRLGGQGGAAEAGPKEAYESWEDVTPAELQASSKEETDKVQAALSGLMAKYEKSDNLGSVYQDIDNNQEVPPEVRAQFKANIQKEMTDQMLEYDPDLRELAKTNPTLAKQLAWAKWHDPKTGKIVTEAVNSDALKDLWSRIAGMHTDFTNKLQNPILAEQQVLDRFFKYAGVGSDKKNQDALMEKLHGLSPDERYNLINKMLPQDTGVMNIPYASEVTQAIDHLGNAGWMQKNTERRAKDVHDAAVEMAGDPRVRGTFSGGVSEAVAAITNMAEVSALLPNGFGFFMQAADQERTKIKAEHPELTEEQVNKKALWGAAVNSFGLELGGKVFSSLFDPLLKSIGNPVARRLSNAMVSGLSTGVTGAAGSAGADVLRGDPVDVKAAEHMGAQGFGLGLFHGAMHLPPGRERPVVEKPSTPVPGPEHPELEHVPVISPHFEVLPKEENLSQQELKQGRVWEHVTPEETQDDGYRGPVISEGGTTGGGTTFSTAKGSTYEVHDDGTTTRNKAYRPEHGVAEQGLQERSHRTIYVTPADAQKLGEIQTRGGPAGNIEQASNGQWGVRYREGKDQGKFERRTMVAHSDTPAKGLIPVEIWDKGKRVHFGNEITEVRSAEANHNANIAEVNARNLAIADRVSKPAVIGADERGNIRTVQKGRSTSRVTVQEMLDAGGDSAVAAQKALDAGFNPADPMPKSEELQNGRTRQVSTEELGTPQLVTGGEKKRETAGGTGVGDSSVAGTRPDVFGTPRQKATSQDEALAQITHYHNEHLKIAKAMGWETEHSPDDIFTHVRPDNRTIYISSSPEAYLQYAKDFKIKDPTAMVEHARKGMDEEITHALDYHSLRDEYDAKKAAGQIPETMDFHRWMGHEGRAAAREIFKAHDDAVAAGNHKLARIIRNSVVTGDRLYHDTKLNFNGIRNHLDWLEKGSAEDQLKAWDMLFSTRMEIARQMDQAARRGEVSETEIPAWRKMAKVISNAISKVINTLKKAHGVALKGEFGPLMQKHLQGLINKRRSMEAIAHGAKPPPGTEDAFARPGDALPSKTGMAKPRSPTRDPTEWEKFKTGYSSWWKGGESFGLDQPATRDMAKQLRRMPSYRQNIIHYAGIHELESAMRDTGWSALHPVKSWGEREKIGKEFEDWFKARDRKVAPPVLSPKTQRLVDATVNTLDKLGQLAQRMGIKVSDDRGNVHPFTMIKDYFPRIMSRDVENIFEHRNGKRAADFNRLLADSIHKGVVKTRDEFIQKFERSSMPETISNAFFANAERTRQMHLPLEMYDWSPVGIARYVSRMTDRLAEIRGVGQKITSTTKDLFDLTKDKITADHSLSLSEKKNMSTRVETERNAVYNREFVNHIGSSIQGSKNVVSATVLGNWFSSASNTIGGLVSNVGFGGPVSAGKAYGKVLYDRILKGGSLVKQTHEWGLMGHQLHDMADDFEKVLNPGWALRGAPGYTRSMMHLGLQNTTEALNRTVAMQQAKYLLAKYQKWGAPGAQRGFFGARARHMEEFFRRRGLSDIEMTRLYAEGGDPNKPIGQEFIRQFAMDTHGNYGPSQTASWLYDSPWGKVLFMFQKFTTNQMRMVTREYLAPLARADSALKGKNVTNPEALGDYGFQLMRNFGYFAVLVPAGGMAINAAINALRGREGDTASWAQIGKEFQKGNGGHAIQEYLTKVWQAYQLAGMTGPLGNYVGLGMTAFGFTHDKLKNPLNPPMYSVMVQPLVTYLQKAIQQGGNLLEDFGDRHLIGEFLQNISSIRVATNLIGNVETKLGLDDPVLHLGKENSLRNDAMFLSSRLRMYEDEHPELKKQAASTGPTNNDFSPYRTDLMHALRYGDSATAVKSISDYLDRFPPGEVPARLDKIRDSVNSSTPVKPGGQYSLQHQLEFLRWAKDTQSEEDARKLFNIAQVYAQAAVDTNFLASPAMRALAKMRFENLGNPPKPPSQERQNQAARAGAQLLLEMQRRESDLRARGRR